MSARTLRFLAAAAALSLVGCPSTEPVPDATPVPTPVATPEPTPEPTPEATPVPTPVPFSDALQALLDGASDAERARTNPKSGDAAAIEIASAEFGSTCSPCHGPEGKGDGPAAKALGITPADLSAPDFGEKVPPGIQFKIMKNGVKGTSMQAFGAAMSDNQIWQILAFVETLSKPPTPPPVDTPPE